MAPFMPHCGCHYWVLLGQNIEYLLGTNLFFRVRASDQWILPPDFPRKASNLIEVDSNDRRRETLLNERTRVISTVLR